jgi:lipoprotein-anchoring transpeptidase ErfK/SrfK
MKTIVAGLALPLAMAGPAPGPVAEGETADDVPLPEPADRPGPVRHTIARVRKGKTVELRSRPGGGRVLARLRDRTEFGSPRAFPVLRRRGRWLAVPATEMPNGRVGWIKLRRSQLRVSETPVSIHADLSERTVEYRRGARIVQRFRVTIGRPGSSTPTGTFGVTDKMPGRRFSSYYGCCILALSGKQPSPPPGWPGGNRLAIHGTNAPWQIGRAASAGCLRARDAALRILMRQVPLGAPVVIAR